MLKAVATAVTVVGTLQQGVAAKRAAKFNASVAKRNAEVARRNAVSAAEQQRRENYLRIGAIRANVGASGGTRGSALDMLGDVATQGEMAVRNIFTRGAEESAGLESTASMERSRARSAMPGAALAAGGALAGGAADLSEEQPVKDWLDRW